MFGSRCFSPIRTGLPPSAVSTQFVFSRSALARRGPQVSRGEAPMNRSTTSVGRVPVPSIGGSSFTWLSTLTSTSCPGSRRTFRYSLSSAALSPSCATIQRWPLRHSVNVPLSAKCLYMPRSFNRGSITSTLALRFSV
jgi:hypothetical protein